MACRHPHETTGRRSRPTRRRPPRPADSTSRSRSPPRTTADAHAAPATDDPANAPALAPPDQTHAPSTRPSQLLMPEVLQRPLESAQHSTPKSPTAADLV